jgi:hypothetical protein
MSKKINDLEVKTFIIKARYYGSSYGKIAIILNKIYGITVANTTIMRNYKKWVLCGDVSTIIEARILKPKQEKTLIEKVKAFFIEFIKGKNK